MIWLAVLLYWVESLFYDLDGMQPLVLPLAALAVPLPALFPGLASSSAHAARHRVQAASRARDARLQPVHDRAAARGADGAASSGGCTSAATASPADLPPLLTLEQLLFRIIGAAFVLLTLTLASGIAFSEGCSAARMRFDHKTVFAVLSWLIFGRCSPGACSTAGAGAPRCAGR